jgi:hypothetical protein
VTPIHLHFRKVLVDFALLRISFKLLIDFLSEFLVKMREDSVASIMQQSGKTNAKFILASDSKLRVSIAQAATHLSCQMGNSKGMFEPSVIGARVNKNGSS